MGISRGVKVTAIPLLEIIQCVFQVDFCTVAQNFNGTRSIYRCTLFLKEPVSGPQAINPLNKKISRPWLEFLNQSLAVVLIEAQDQINSVWGNHDQISQHDTKQHGLPPRMNILFIMGKRGKVVTAPNSLLITDDHVISLESLCGYI